jgi:hypothetical protein
MSLCDSCKSANRFFEFFGIDCVDCLVLGLNTICPEDVVCECYPVSDKTNSSETKEGLTYVGRSA